MWQWKLNGYSIQNQSNAKNMQRSDVIVPVSISGWMDETAFDVSFADGNDEGAMVNDFAGWDYMLAPGYL